MCVCGEMVIDKNKHKTFFLLFSMKGSLIQRSCYADQSNFNMQHWHCSPHIRCVNGNHLRSIKICGVIANKRTLFSCVEYGFKERWPRLLYVNMNGYIILLLLCYSLVLVLWFCVCVWCWVIFCSMTEWTYMKDL